MKQAAPGQLGMPSQPTFSTRVNSARQVNLGQLFSYVIARLIYFHVNMSQDEVIQLGISTQPGQAASIQSVKLPNIASSNGLSKILYVLITNIVQPIKIRCKGR